MAMTSVAASPIVGGISALPTRTSFRSHNDVFVRFGLRSTLPGATGGVRKLSVRCDGIRETIDKATKKNISEEEILQNQAKNESEQRSVMGTKPTSGSFYPRPEVERRPETGDRDIGSLFAFDGAAPETINGRLAMLGIVWAFLAERATGLTVYDQLYTQGTGLIAYVTLVPIVAYASIVPMINGESTDARSFGPFTAKFERWSGRLAMLGFLSLVVTESFTRTPIFNTLFK